MLIRNHAARLEAAKREIADLHHQLRADIEKGKSEPGESRVAALAADQNASRYSDIRVFACAQLEREEEARTMAEMVGRQLLLFAQGAELIPAGEGFKLNASGKVSGARVSVVASPSGYTIVELNASIRTTPTPQAKASSVRRIAVAKKGQLVNVLQDIMEAVDKAVRRVESPKAGDKASISSTAGAPAPAAMEKKVGGWTLVYLRTMELIPNTNPPECRYKLDIYESEASAKLGSKQQT